MRRIILTSLLMLFASLLSAAPSGLEVRAEIDALLSTLEKSGCEFKRNGSWYSASEAKSHLLKKLEYIEGKGALQSTEQFIALGASKSSMSGQPYLVRCGSAPPIESRTWLTTQLAARRATSQVGASSPK
jgi:hypothetical protein